VEPVEADAARRDDSPPPRKPHEHRGHLDSKLAAEPPRGEEREAARVAARDREASMRFAAALAPMLAPEARERALDVRVRLMASKA
jgi:hypothetical protein